MYTSNTCAQCKMVKRLLTVRNIAYEELNIDEHPEYHKEVQSLSGQLRVPVTVKENGNIVVGYNPMQLLAS